MKLSNFLFPESREPALDERVIDETIAEARLTEQLGFWRGGNGLGRTAETTTRRDLSDTGQLCATRRPSFSESHSLEA